MILAEPPPSQGDLHFSLLGFPVRIHPWFWLTAVLLGDLSAKPISVLMWVVAVLACILLHELGHAVVMRYYGYDVSIVLYSFGGLAIPHRGRPAVRQPGPFGQILICLAGPAAGFILAAVLALGLHYLGRYQVSFLESSWRDVVPLVLIPDHPLLTMFLYFVFQISVYWGILNLLPIFPLDGGQAAQQFFVLTNPHDSVRQTLILSVIVGGMMAVVAGVQWHDWFLVIFFAWLTYSNFSSLQSI